MFTKTLLISLIAILSTKIFNCFEIHEKEFLRYQNTKVSDNFELKFEHGRLLDSFPASFQADLDSFDINQSIKFEKIDSESEKHPVLSDDVYLYENSEDKIVQINSKNQKTHEVYQDKNGQCVATLFKNEKKQFKMLGSCLIDGKTVHIVPVKVNNQQRLLSANNPHGLISQTGSEKQIFDYTLPTEQLQNVERQIDKKIAQRQVGPVIVTVETLVVADYSNYLAHQNLTQITNQTILVNYMRTYYTHMFNWINAKYQNTFSNDPQLRISVRIKNFIFSLTSADSTWTSQTVAGISGVTTYNGKEVISASKALNAIGAFVRSKAPTYSFDHAAGFSSKDFWNDDSTAAASSRSSVAGLAWLASACKNASYFSVSEDNGILSGINVAAHEIGHNLGTDHDGGSGIYSTCLSSSGFVMAPSVTTGVNSNRFSSCSVAAIKNYIIPRGVLSSTVRCLTVQDNFAAPSIATADPGQTWTADDQCKMAFSKSAIFSSSYANKMCQTLFCRLSPTSGSLMAVGAALPGTVCGSGRVCLNNTCVVSSKAPIGDCVFGDDGYISYFADLPTSNCETYMENVITSYNQNPCLAASSYPDLKAMCCKSCKIYEGLNCFNQYSNCNDLKSYCSSSNIATNCPITCGTCRQKRTCDVLGNICQNGGTCVSLANVATIASFNCTCPAGYFGRFCEYKNPCVSPNPCSSGQTCIRMGSLGYTCA